MRSYFSTATDRTWQSSEYDSWFVPYHQEVLRAHQSHFCLRVIAEDGGFQSDVSDIQTETEQKSTIMCMMREIGMYLRERVRRRLMSAAVFPGVVWPLLTLYTSLHEFWCGKVRMAKWQPKVCTWLCKTNEHIPRVSCRRRFPVYISPRWVSDMDLKFMGSAQGVPMELRCW
jgi:hypothetical protein